MKYHALLSVLYFLLSAAATESEGLPETFNPLPPLPRPVFPRIFDA